MFKSLQNGKNKNSDFKFLKDSKSYNDVLWNQIKIRILWFYTIKKIIILYFRGMNKKWKFINLNPKQLILYNWNIFKFNLNNRKKQQWIKILKG